MEKMIFSNIPSYNWEYIEKKGKKLAKYGVEIALKEVYMKEGKVSSDFNPYKPTKKVEFKEECISIEITFPETLEKGNWEFLGLKVAFEDTFLTFGNVPNEYKNDSFRCDHCHSDRYRKSVVIIKNTENGEIKQVGKTCLDRYLNNTLKQFAGLLLTIDEIMENALNKDESGFFSGFSMWDKYFDVEKFLICAYNDIVARGYHKRDSYEVQYNNVDSTLTGTNHEYDKFNRGLTLEEKNTVKECKQAYIDFVEKRGKDDFAENVLKLISANFIERKYQTMIVFIPTFLLNKRKFDAEKKAKQEQAKKFSASLNNTYAGNIKDKLNLTVRLINVHSYENCWDGYHTSYTYMYTFISDEGHLLQWKTAKYIEIKDENGNYIYNDQLIDDKIKFNLAGTVKEQKEFRDRFYTVLTRCKITQ